MDNRPQFHRSLLYPVLLALSLRGYFCSNSYLKVIIMKALPIQTTVYTNLGFGTVTRAFLGGTFYNVTFADGYTCERRHSEVIEVVKGYTESDYKKALKAYDTAYFAFEGDTSEFNKTASDFLPVKKGNTMKNINKQALKLAHSIKAAYSSFRVALLVAYKALKDSKARLTILSGLDKANQAFSKLKQPAKCAAMFSAWVSVWNLDFLD